MVVEEPLLRLGVILALAAGGVVVLLLLTLIMYACCKGYRGRATLPPPNLAFRLRQDVSAIYSPTVIAYRHENAEVCPVPLPTSILQNTGKPDDDSNPNIIDFPTDPRGRTPPPPYDEVVCVPLSEKPLDEHNYST